MRGAEGRSRSRPDGGRRVGIVGGGWAGLAAAVEAAGRGHAVTLFEMAPTLGGRARAIAIDGAGLDNGQHILIGAYRETLRLMQVVGVDSASVLRRLPLQLIRADGSGLRLGPGHPMLAFALAVLRQRSWTRRQRLALLATAARWLAAGFRCDPLWTVADLTRALPDAIRRELTDPLCVAALNTPAAAASGQVFLRVLRDALATGAGSADLLLPTTDLTRLFPAAAAVWLERAGARLALGRRVSAICRTANGGWQVEATGGGGDVGDGGDHSGNATTQRSEGSDGSDGSDSGAARKVRPVPVRSTREFDHLILACAAKESARLVAAIAPAWAAQAAGLQHEPIVTVYLTVAGARLREPMLTLPEDDAAPAQFVFDRGQLGGPAGLLAFVVSGASAWSARGTPAIEAAVVAQARLLLGPAAAVGVAVTVNEKRATFRCTPGLVRPSRWIATGLSAAGDQVAGPYPATLEGAVRSGVAAARGVDRDVQDRSDGIDTRADTRAATGADAFNGGRTVPPAARR